ncbi:MAG: hypothetical protein CBC42_04770 [Betaproteobacteria bacterium TMED82]|nr:MAG: hypothetical protein CBC42_04770 [Betaproteobacteria bacterium TMED82]|tara:strand:- start:15181 stop:16098 length:918 start_codon:yes stop_codon:yes gene_type:complete
MTKFRLFVARPVWENEPNKWLMELRGELNSEIAVYFLSIQQLRLENSKLFLKELDRGLHGKANRSLFKKRKFLLFSSPASVEAVFKIFQKLARRPDRLRNLRSLMSNIKKTFLSFNRKNGIKLGAIGEGTATNLQQHFRKLSSRSPRLKRKNIYYLPANATALAWVEEFGLRVKRYQVLAVGGKSNSDKLLSLLDKRSVRVRQMVPYSRVLENDANECKVDMLMAQGILPASDFYENFILISSSQLVGPVLGKLELKLFDENSFTLVSHHDQIVNKVKEIIPEIKVMKIQSLDPKCIAREINSRL